MSEELKNNARELYKSGSRRAQWHHYDAPRAYLISICTAGRKPIFGTYENGSMYFSEHGQIVCEEWEKSFQLRESLVCDYVCILPDQINAIVRILPAEDNVPLTPQHTARLPLQREARSISSFAAEFKASVTRRINLQRDSRGENRVSIWQTRFYDHIIRSPEEHRFLLQFLQQGRPKGANTLRDLVEAYVETHCSASLPSHCKENPPHSEQTSSPHSQHHSASTPPAFFPLPPELERAAEAALAQIAPQFEQIEETTEYNQQKVLHAFIKHRVSESHFVGSTGYGYGDRGREVLEDVFADIMGAEAALMRHSFASGTHTLAVALFGLLRPGDTMLNLTGTPYDTLHSVIGLKGSGMGSLKDFGIRYEQVELTAEGRLDFNAIAAAIKQHRPKLVYLQRSRGYTLRPSLFVEEIAAAAKLAKELCGCIVMVDNCYGEFVQREEPTQLGADLIAGSLIKNPGGGVARNGGYIAGRRDLVDLCAYRMTAAGIGGEVGATLGVNRDMFMGLFHAPHVVGEALKTALFAAALLEQLDFEASPKWDEPRADIIQSIRLGTPEALIAFCQGLQSGAPVDAFVTPEPWDMPGYDNQVIMAAGAFIMGSSIELSADAPLREPYAVWLQGGLNFHSGKIGVLMGAKKILELKRG